MKKAVLVLGPAGSGKSQMLLHPAVRARLRELNWVVLEKDSHTPKSVRLKIAEQLHMGPTSEAFTASMSPLLRTGLYTVARSLIDQHYTVVVVDTNNSLHKKVQGQDGADQILAWLGCQPSELTVVYLLLEGSDEAVQAAAECRISMRTIEDSEAGKLDYDKRRGSGWYLQARAECHASMATWREKGVEVRSVDTLRTEDETAQAFLAAIQSG